MNKIVLLLQRFSVFGINNECNKRQKAYRHEAEQTGHPRPRPRSLQQIPTMKHSHSLLARSKNVSKKTIRIMYTEKDDLYLNEKLVVNCSPAATSFSKIV